MEENFYDEVLKEPIHEEHEEYAIYDLCSSAISFNEFLCDPVSPELEP